MATPFRSALSLLLKNVTNITARIIPMLQVQLAEYGLKYGESAEA